MRVRWFRNSHEHRNYWLRFGLMRLHVSGCIKYEEYPLAACLTHGFAQGAANYEHRHTSLILVESGPQKVRCVVDSEDSFFWMSPLIQETDVYFCAGYNGEFFRKRRFTPPYAWQALHEVSFYVERARELIDNFGQWFERVKPFVPICPNADRTSRPPPAVLKLRNAHHKLTSALRAGEGWRFAYSDFEARYRSLISLRAAPLLYDVVLLDTLWGWPRHRHALHMRLKQLANDRKINACLRWSAPTSMDGGDRFPLREADFPIESGRVDNYEEMLASSRVGVFATGFHYGWRNIMTLALMFGLPVHADRLLLEPWFDMRNFAISWNDEADWPGVATEIGAISDKLWISTKSHNQAAFDRFLAPEKVAEYFVSTALS